MDASKKYHLQAFEGEMKISTTSYPETFTIETVRFSPLPDENIIFYFEACHTQVSAPLSSGFGFASSTRNFTFVSNPSKLDPYPKSEFLLKLRRQSSSKLNQLLVMNVYAKLYYCDGSLFKSCESHSDIKVDQMDSLAFETISHSIYNQQPNLFNCFSDHSNKMKKGALTLKYKIFFHDDSSITASQEDVPISSSFSNNLKSVYESSEFKDFVFNVGDKSFSVHKVILAAHSPVFMKMMTQDCLESKTNSVTITDATPDILELFLKYFYSGKVEDESWPTVKDLYCLADKYDVGILKNDCVDVIISLMSVDLACEILKLAYTYDDFNLKSAAKKFSVDHIKELIPREDWKDLMVLHPVIGYEVIVNFVPK